MADCGLEEKEEGIGLILSGVVIGRRYGTATKVPYLFEGPLRSAGRKEAEGDLEARQLSP